MGIDPPSPLIVGSPLTKQQLKELCDGSAITEEVALDRDYRWIETPADLGYLGFPTYQRAVGLLIPMGTVDGIVGGYQLRAEKPTKRKKYESPQGQRTMLDVPKRCLPVLNNPSIPLWITEGSKKADSGVSHGLYVLSLSGVFAWRCTNEFGGKLQLPDFEAIAWNGRTVYLCFDSDWRQNPMVREGLRRLGARLSLMGAKVLYVDLPAADGNKVGLDDYFVAGGQADRLTEYASPKPPEPFEFHIGDLGNAERLVGLFGSEIRYVAATGYHVWEGDRWRTDQEGDISIKRLAFKVTDDVLQEAVLEKDDDRKKALTELAGKLQTKRTLDNMINLASALPNIEASADDFDNNPYLLAVGNGTLDLITGELWKSQPSDMCTLRAGCIYDPTAECPQFLAFLSQILLGREDLQRFMVASLGYTLSGETGAHAFWFLTGDGRNGKGVLMNIIQKILGTYATTLMPESIMVKKFDTIPADLAKLHKKRLAVVPEVDNQKQLNTGLIKALSGSDTITARFMRENFFEFKNTAKLWLMGNEKPYIRNFNTAIVRRMKVVPFDFTVTKELEDTRLEQKLWEESPGILALLVKGYQVYRQFNLPDSEAVTNAVEAYKKEVDQVASFIFECCDLEPGIRLAKKDLYDKYKEWCDGDGDIKAYGKKKFYDHVRQQGVKVATTMTHGDYPFEGIRIKGALPL